MLSNSLTPTTISMNYKLSIRVVLSAPTNAKGRTALRQPALLLAQPSLPFYLSLAPMDSHIPNSPFNAPGQAVKVGGNATQVNIRRGGPLVAQKLLYVSYVGLLRFDQTNGKIMPSGVEPEGGYPCFPAKPL